MKLTSVYKKPKMIGNDLINLVYEYLKLVESDYFGLEFYDSKGKKVSIYSSSIKHLKLLNFYYYVC